MKLILSLLTAGLMTGAAQAQIEWRVSVKFICDANGKRPSGAWIGNHLYAPLTNASQVSNYIAAANLIMDRSGRGYRFRLEEISDVQGAAEYYTADSRDEASRWQVELAARNNPQQYFWRDDALNIYINNSPQGAICGFPVDPLPSGAQLWNIILAGQGGGGATYTNTFAHESGHYFGLCHTMGCLCAACNEGVGCDHNPQDDGIADTLLDTECWTMDDLAKANFNVSHYSLLDSDQQRQVNNTYSNLMSYHDFAYILTSDQLDRMTDTSNGARNNACNRQTVFVDKDNTALSVDGLPNDYKRWAEKNPPRASGGAPAAACLGPSRPLARLHRPAGRPSVGRPPGRQTSTCPGLPLRPIRPIGVGPPNHRPQRSSPSAGHERRSTRAWTRPTRAISSWSGPATMTSPSASPKPSRFAPPVAT